MFALTPGLAPNLLGFAWLPGQKLAPLAGLVVVPNPGTAGKGWLRLLLLLLVLQSERSPLLRRGFLQMFANLHLQNAWMPQNVQNKTISDDFITRSQCIYSRRSQRR